MVDGNGAHPSPDRLVAFAQGRLNEDELVAMSRHLQRCPGCLSAAESMPGDFFVATLRQHAPQVSRERERPDKPPAVPASQQPAPAAAEPSGAKPSAVAGAPAGRVGPPAAPAVAPAAAPAKPPQAPARPGGPAAPPMPMPVGAGPAPPAPPARPPASPKKAAPPPGNEPPALTGYQDFYVVGEGGMGVVYRAWQPNLKRWVALKVIRSEALADPHLLARFKKEAQGIARLRHPNIVTLHDISEYEGQPYLLLEYVDGGSLADRWNHVPQPPKEAAALVEVLARAMQHAHEQKLIHRDLKPGNILLTKDGQPKITDFGLVKRLHSGLGPGSSDPESSLSLTMTTPGTIMGTPNYMAPEQIWGGSEDIDARADVYALGAILYEGLTGRPPFRGATVHQTLDLVLNTQPKPPREIRPDVPADLEAVCLKSLAKDAKQRYASARDFADDLERFLHHRPVLARRRQLHERALEWFRTRTRSTTAVGAVMAALVVGLTLSLCFLVKERGRTADAEAATADALEQKEQSDRLAYAGSIVQAQRAWQEGRTGQAVRLLEGLRPESGGKDRRGWEWYYLYRLSAPGRTLRLSATEGWQPMASGVNRWPGAEGAPLRSIACSPDGRLLATGGDDRQVRLWDVRTGKLLRTLSGHTERVNRVAFGRGTRESATAGAVPGGWLASAGDDRKVLVWDIGKAELRYTYENHEAAVLDVLFTADGRRVYSTAADGSVQGWDPESGAARQDLQPGGGEALPVRRLALAGSRLFGATAKGLVAWKTDSGMPAQIPNPKPQAPNSGFGSSDLGFGICLAASPDGKFLAVGTTAAIQLCKLDAKSDGLEVVCTFRSSVVRGLLSVATDSGPSELAFSVDGKSLASAGPDQVLRVWDCSRDRLTDHGPRTTGNGQSENVSPKRMFRGHDRAVTGICFSPNGERFFSTSADHTVKGWDLNAPPEPRLLAGGASPVRALAFGAGGRLTVIGDDATVRLWGGGTAKSALEYLGKHEADAERPAAVDVAFSSDGKWIASAASDPTVRLWDANQANSKSQIRTPKFGSSDLRFGICLKHRNPVTCVCFDRGPGASSGPEAPAAGSSGSGEQLATGDAAGGVHLWDVDKAKRIRSFKGFGVPAPAGRGVVAVAFGAEGRAPARAGLLAAAADRTVKVWDAETGKELLLIEGHEGELRALAFSSNGKVLATGGDDEAARLWDAESGKLLCTLEGHAGPVSGLAFSPDGRRLATAGGGSDATVRLWDVETGRELLQLAGAGRCVAFSPDGKRLAAADSSGQVLLWTANSGK